MRQFSKQSSVWRYFAICLGLFVVVASFNNCSGPGSSSSVGGALGGHSITLDFTRIDQAGFDPFKVTAKLTKGTRGIAGETLSLTIPRGTVSAVTDKGDGSYEFTVTPATSGIYPVEVAVVSKGVSIKREAIVANTFGSGVGQPLLVPGVNSPGYEDGVTVTPDGSYLFVQYGPLYFSGMFAIASICQAVGYTQWDLSTCPGKADSNWVFDTVGPYAAPERPHFPTGAINNGKLVHLDIEVPGVAKGIPLFPTVFYGFKKQPDGSFAEPFKLAFNDAKGANGPFGLSFQMTGANTAKYVVAWNNYFNDLGDDKPDIYSGTVVMGQTNSMGDVAYAGEFFSSITPNISPVGFSSHTGVQGNPHLYYDSGGIVRSIWVDDEQVSHNLSVYKLTSGTFPSGNWSLVNLPSKINTAAGESQPFFTGSRLYLTRETKIVYHEYIGVGHNDYDLNTAWGNEVVVIEAGNSAVGTVYGFGEPTIASVGAKKYLYFTVVKVRSAGVGANRYDMDLDAGYVEIQ